MMNPNEDRLAPIEQRLARLEAQVNYPLTRLNIDPAEFDAQFQPEALAPGQMDELKSLLRRGQKINAIKHYRLYTGVGLKEAKDAMDALEKQLE
jgi:large subunit ribosomal protein L7/L12